MNSELYARIVNLLKGLTAHYECEDGYYSCPKSESYFGGGSRDHCYCPADEARAILKDLGIVEITIDTL